MASTTAKVPENVHGKFYMDSSCIYCGLCDKTAPTVFRECNEQVGLTFFISPRQRESFASACRPSEVARLIPSALMETERG
jgi:ferredoxin